jgi:membrane-bound serine protease (ClpP class)
MLIGMYGIMFELFYPGAILPGIVGVISLILAFYSMQTLPVNYAGLALIVFALILFVVEVKIPSHGLLALSGIGSFVLGSFMLFHSNSNLGFMGISRSIIIFAAVLSGLFFFFIIGMGLKAQKAKPVTGISGMIGENGVTLEELNPSGMVHVHGERWQAEAVSGRIEKGEKVRVVDIKNLKLWVEATMS